MRSPDTGRSETGNREAPSPNWWELCPVCGAKLVNRRCRYVCSNPRCHYFQSCSEFDT